MAGKDYYKTIGVDRKASAKEIKQAYRKLARQYHPDVNPGDKAAEAKFKEINEAHEVLSDPEKRKKYDQFGENWQYADQFAGAQPGGPQYGHWDFSSGGGPGGTTFHFEDLGGGGFGNMFDSILGDFAGKKGRRAAMRGQDFEHPIEVTLEEAYHGTTRMLETQVEEACPSCKGEGCPKCGRSGRILRPQRIEVKVPAGVKDASRVRIAGKGGKGFGGGPAGDLYLRVSVRPHARFQRTGDDLNIEMSVPLLDAVLGTEIEVPTLAGKKLALKVPPETQNGKAFRLAGQGIPHMGGRGRGDLFVKVNVVLPTKLSGREKELFEELKSIRT
jgi:DnaJ-class molecular chaperone